MSEIYVNNRLFHRRASDDKILAQAEEDLRRTVLRNGKKKTATPLMKRRLPLRRLTFKDLLIFASKSLTAADVIYVLVASGIVALLGMFIPFLNKQIFDSIIPSGELSNLVPIAVVLATIGVGAIMFSVTRQLILMRIRDKISVDLQAAVIHRSFSLPSDFYRKRCSGETGARVMAVTNVCTLMSDTVISGLLTMIFSLIYFYQVSLYGKNLLGICILMMVLNLCISLVSFLVNRRFQKKIQPVGAELNGFLFSLMRGIQKIKTGGAEKRAFAHWANLFGQSSPDTSEKPRFVLLAPALTLLVSLGGTLLIYRTAYVSEMTISDYIAFNVAFGLVSGALTKFNEILPALSALRPNLDLLSPMLDAEPEDEDSSIQVDHLNGSIEITNLKFRYDNASPYLFDGLSLRINAGEYVGIVGSSGCGKSTLVRLLLGFEKPESGTIFYDQYNIATINKKSLRKHIGTCLQDNALFGGSILSNITLTAPNASMDEAWEAADLAAVADDIREMPMQMFTLVHDNGSGLSGGQRQRVLIARAMIRKPAILLMDEATSALDNICQDKVARNLAATKCTRICVAHRLSTVAGCDRILVLDKGRIAEEGNYESLMKKKGLFYELVNRQLS